MNVDVKWAYLINFYDLRYLQEDAKEYTFVHWAHDRRAVAVFFDKIQHNSIIFKQLTNHDK